MRRQNERENCAGEEGEDRYEKAWRGREGEERLEEEGGRDMKGGYRKL